MVLIIEVNQIKKIKKIRINRTIFFVLSAMIFTFSCSDQSLNDEQLSSSCANTKEKLWSLSNLSEFEKDKFNLLYQERLLSYIDEFKEAAKLNNLDWELLAAIAFQESQWNPKARSATQVKGMMMLTLPTAKSLGVENRLDPVQSINGGASYIAKLIDEINFGTSTGDTISIALAAYNLGVGNINRYLEKIQINSNKEKFEITWDDLSSFLTEEVNHNELTGNSTNYKRGIQAVDYVTRVKDYYYLILGLGCN